jgi:RNA polymerase sigma-70 factor (ECF subfamily)
VRKRLPTLLQNLRDEELMLRFQQGNEAGFRLIMERHKQRVYNLVFRFMGGMELAEDIAQEVFVKVYLAKKNYQERAKFTTWLYVICKNTCLKAIKKLQAKRQISLEANDEQKSILAQTPDTKAVNPAKEVLKQEKAKKIVEAIKQLPETQRMVILLRRYDKLSYDEIAEIMDCSVSSVKSLLFRGRVNLKEKLKEYLKEGIYE